MTATQQAFDTINQTTETLDVEIAALQYMINALRQHVTEEQFEKAVQDTINFAQDFNGEDDDDDDE